MENDSSSTASSRGINLPLKVLKNLTVKPSGLGAFVFCMFERATLSSSKFRIFSNSALLSDGIWSI